MAHDSSASQALVKLLAQLPGSAFNAAAGLVTGYPTTAILGAVGGTVLSQVGANVLVTVLITK